jgi:hypothetical protein
VWCFTCFPLSDPGLLDFSVVLHVEGDPPPRPLGVGLGSPSPLSKLSPRGQYPVSEKLLVPFKVFRVVLN